MNVSVVFHKTFFFYRVCCNISHFYDDLYSFYSTTSMKFTCVYYKAFRFIYASCVPVLKLTDEKETESRDSSLPFSLSFSRLAYLALSHCLNSLLNCLI